MSLEVSLDLRLQWDYCCTERSCSCLSCLVLW